MKPLVALLGLLAAFMVYSGTLTMAETTYTPQWETRLAFSTSVGSYQVDEVWGAGSLNGVLYVSGNYLNSTNNHNGIAVFSVDVNTGNPTAVHYIYSNSYDILSLSLAANDNYVYIVGYYDSAAWIGALDTNLDSLLKTNYFSVSNHASYYNAVCLDGDGNVYAVGVDWDYSVSPPRSYVLLSSYTPTLDRRFDQTYSGNYNTTGTDCVVGPDGYLYIVGLDRMYSNNAYYPVHLIVAKISPADGSLISYTYVPLYNKNYQLSSYTDVPAGIDSTGSELIVAFTYTDDESTGTAGASVIGLDTSLNVLWRYNISTSYHERFVSVVAGNDGSFAVAGDTNNPYDTGLSSSVFNGFLLVFDGNHDLVKAILSGDEQGSQGTSVHEVFTDGEGHVFWIGFAGNDDEVTGYYDVTNSVSVLKNTAGTRYGLEGKVVKLTEIKPPRLVAVNNKTGTTINAWNNNIPGKQLLLKTISGKPSILTTPSGYSNGIIVSTREQIGTHSPAPSPVPEIGVLVALGELAGLSLFFLYRIINQK